MRILIADDDKISRVVLERTLQSWGHEVVLCPDGDQAWSILQQEGCPRLAILDWMMPGLEGPEVCRRARELNRPVPTYTILLTSKDQTGDIVTGLNSGADDYITKPFDRAELECRIRVGERVVRLQKNFADRVEELENLLARVRRLHGLLPVCAWCKSIRNDRDYWQSVEEYMTELTDMRVTHGICPKCLKEECSKLD